jgi:hypothetical protein
VNKSKVIVILFVLMYLVSYCTNAQYKLVTELIPLRDSTMYRFTNIFDLYTLSDKQNAGLRKNIGKILHAKTDEEVAICIDKILQEKNPLCQHVLGLDYYFKGKKPAVGSNVELFIDKLKNQNIYTKINKAFQYGCAENDYLKDSVQTKIGWVYGYGAIYYLSPADSAYLRRMKKVDTHHLDEEVEIIIEKYLADVKPIFKYDIEAILTEIKNINGVKDIIHDGCLIKVDMLPGYDQIGVLYVKGTDTAERVYTIQIGKFTRLRIGKWCNIPLKSTDELWYKGADYGLHYIQRTRKQCEQNKAQSDKNRQEYEEYLKAKENEIKK